MAFLRLKLSLATFLVFAVLSVEAGKRGDRRTGAGTFTMTGTGSGPSSGFFGGLTPGGVFSSFPNVRHGLIVCRREDENGQILEPRKEGSEKCPSGSSCNSPDGGLTVQVGDVVNKLFYCNNTYPTPALACKAKNSTGHDIKLPSSCDCPEGKQCAGGPVNGKDIFGKDITYYVCVKEPTADPKPDYAEAVLKRTCCGGETFNFHMQTGGNTSSSSSTSSLGGSDVDPGKSGSKGKKKGRKGKSGGGRRRNP